MKRRISVFRTIRHGMKTLIAVVMICGLILPFGSVSISAQEVSGEVVGQGTLNTEGDQDACVFPKITFGEHNDSSVSESTMIIEVTPDCQLVVTEVNKVPSGMTTFDTWHEGAAWTEHHDCCGIVMTESFAYMQYSDDGSSVYGGGSPDLACKLFPDGWVFEAEDWDMNPNGPGSVSIWNDCTFDFYDGSFYHTLDATFYGWPGGAWDHYCDIYGSIVAGGHLECGGNWN